MIPSRDKRTDISSEIARGRKLQTRIKNWAEEAAATSVENNTDLNEALAAIGKRENLNRLQIQRLVEEANTVTYNKRYDKVRTSNDRRIDFTVGSLTGVVEEMGDDAPPEIENPNLATGRPGQGELDKAASIEPSYLHNPNGRLKERQEKYMQKTAALKERQAEKEKAAMEKERESTLFKIANALVMSEKVHRNGNEVFNTMLSDVPLDEESVEGITKKAASIGEQLVKTNRIRPDFMVTLTENSTEKVASHVLGEYSLLKQAETEKIKEVKVTPTVDVSDYQQLINLARKLEQQGKINKQPLSVEQEVKQNG